LSLNFHDAAAPSEISEHMFKFTSRLMPEPILAYEQHMLEPLTSVFADFQDSYNK